MPYRLQLAFEDCDEFQREFERNIAMGGAFVFTTDPLQIGSVVELAVDLMFCGERMVIEAEVLHRIAPEHALNPRDVGVAISFRRSAEELQADLVRFVDETPSESILASDASGGHQRETAQSPVVPLVLPPWHTPTTRFLVARPVSGSEGVSDLEASLLDLARARLPISRMLEIVPEAPRAIHEGLRKLVDAGHLKPSQGPLRAPRVSHRQYPTIPGQVSFSTSVTQGIGTILDISVSGAHVYRPSATALPGTRIELFFLEPTTKRRLHAIAEVVRQTEVGFAVHFSRVERELEGLVLAAASSSEAASEESQQSTD